MTKQEIFNTVWDYFVTQKHPASLAPGPNGEPRCAYRGANGEKCAVGIFITDECYNKYLEGRRVSDNTVIKALPQSLKEYAHFLSDLQFAHDGAALASNFHSDVETRLRDVAELNNLDVPLPA